MFVLSKLSDIKVNPLFHDLQCLLVSTLQDIQELGTVGSPSEGINDFTAAEACGTVYLTLLLGDKNSPFPHLLSGMLFHRDFKCTLAD